jgi:eukaryotic-like serine/threonine-protein kinase
VSFRGGSRTAGALALGLALCAMACAHDGQPESKSTPASVAGGQPKTAEATPACPSDMVPIVTETPGLPDSFCIDVYEFPNERGALPMPNISWRGARDLCVDRGKRLCTSAEWERACRGPKDLAYPYGTTFDKEACNTPLEGWVDGSSYLYAPAGSFPRCRTSEGVFDLDGNVSEWVADETECPEGDPYFEDLSCRLIRGGTMWKADYGFGCTSTHDHGETEAYLDDGFRCCRALAGRD